MRSSRKLIFLPKARLIQFLSDPVRAGAEWLRDPYHLSLLALIALYVVLFAGQAFDLHMGMRTHKADLGQIDQAVWNSSRGRLLEQIKDDFLATRLIDHVEPIYVLISPVLWLWNDVRALLLLQTLAVALGALPLYHLALARFDRLLSPQTRTQIWRLEPLRQLTRPLALALTLAYLLAPQLQSALLTEFHAIVLTAPLILWAFWAVETRRWGHFALAALLVTLVKEESALLGAGLGVWALWSWSIKGWLLSQSRTRRLHFHISSPLHLFTALALTLLSLLWFYLATFVIVPAHAVQVYDVAESTYFARYGALGNSPVDILTSFVTRPGAVWAVASEPARMRYLALLLAVFGFAPLLAPEILILSLPILLANALSAYPAQYYGEFHYSAPLPAYMAVAAALGLGRIWQLVGRRLQGQSGGFQHFPAAGSGVMALASFFTNSRWALRPLLAGGLIVWLLGSAGIVYAVAGRGPLGGRYDPTPITAHHRLLSRFVAQIPPEAAVTATAAVHPHLSHRRFIYQFPRGLAAPGRAEWALLDVTTNTDMAPGDLKAEVDRMLAGEWGVMDGADGFLLLHKGAPNKEIPPAFYDFARLDLAATTQPPTALSAADKADWRRKWLSWTPVDRQSAIGYPQSLEFGPLTFLGVTLDDWPRWRQTRIVTFWRVEDGLVPGAVRPWLTVRTPAGETLYTYDQITPTALIWYGPDAWRPGELIRIETLGLYLPQVWGAVVGAVHGPDPTAPWDRLRVLPSPQTGERAPILVEAETLALAGSWVRGRDGNLHEADGLPTTRPTAGALFLGPRGEKLAVTAWLAQRSTSAEGGIDLWLLWQRDLTLLQTYTPFVHLRQNGENRQQADGPPTWFVQPDPLLQESRLLDWRQIPLPFSNDKAGWQVVIGLYNPATGERLPLADGQKMSQGDELTVGATRSPSLPTPDQSCALIPLTCQSQPSGAMGNRF